MQRFWDAMPATYVASCVVVRNARPMQECVGRGAPARMSKFINPGDIRVTSSPVSRTGLSYRYENYLLNLNFVNELKSSSG